MTGLCVGILEDHEFVRESLADLLRAECLQVHTAGTPEEFTGLLHRTRLDVAIVDLRLSAQETPPFAGWDVIRKVRQWFPGMGLIVFTGHLNRETAERAIQEGVSALLDKRTAGRAKLLAAIQSVARGERQVPAEYGFVTSTPAEPPPAPEGDKELLLRTLTERERQVLQLVASGVDNLKIAALLGISERTVRAHTSSLYRKLAAENRASLVLFALRVGVRPREF